MTHVLRYLLTLALAISASASSAGAQLASAGDTGPDGRVMTKVVVTISENGAYGHALGGVNFYIVSEDGDRVTVRTNDAGVASVWLKPGTHRIVNPDPAEYDGKAYTWDVTTSVKPGAAAVRLSQSNATRVIAAAPVAVPAVVSSNPAPPSSPVFIQPSLQNAVGKGFHFGLAANGSSLMVDDEDLGQGDAESGGGVSLTLGYNFNPSIGILFAVAGAAISSGGGDYGLGHGDLMVRFTSSAPQRMFRPYAELGITGLALVVDDEDETQLQGGGITGALGFNYFFNKNFALDSNLRYTIGEFTTLKSGGTTITDSDGIGVKTARFNIGISIFP